MSGLIIVQCKTFGPNILRSRLYMPNSEHCALNSAKRWTMSPHARRPWAERLNFDDGAEAFFTCASAIPASTPLAACACW